MALDGLIDSVSAMWCAIAGRGSLRGPGADIDVPDVQQFGMPMELRLELCSVVSLQDEDTEREPFSSLSQEPDRRALIAGIVDLQDSDTGAVATSCHSAGPVLLSNAGLLLASASANDQGSHGSRPVDSGYGKHEKIQVCTIEKVLQGAKPDVPLKMMPSKGAAGARRGQAGEVVVAIKYSNHPLAEVSQRD